MMHKDLALYFPNVSDHHKYSNSYTDAHFAFRFSLQQQLYWLMLGAKTNLLNLFCMCVSVSVFVSVCVRVHVIRTHQKELYLLCCVTIFYLSVFFLM